MISHLIVGSGLSAWATALGLIDKGITPVLVDFGPGASVSGVQISRQSQVAAKGLSRFESAFSYPDSLVHGFDGRHLPLSSNRGGLGEFWGAGILHRRPGELSLDPSLNTEIEVAQLRLARELFPLGSQDQSSLRFDLPFGSTPAPQSFRYSRIVNELQSSQQTDVLFGRPRIAFSRPVSECTRCGLCRSGCPESLFFSPRIAIERLAREDKLRLLDGPVIQISPKDSAIDVRLPSRVVRAAKVFLSAGPIATPALLQRSGLIQEEITVHDSAVFYGLFFNSNVAAGDESGFASSHMVAFSSSAGEDDFQLAFYESHDELTERILSRMRLPEKVVKIPRNIQLRLNPVIGFLDSKCSGRLRLTYSENRTIVTREPNSQTRKTARSVLRRVSKITSHVGLWTLPRLLSVPRVGDGYHGGAGLPAGGKHVSLEGHLISNPNVFITDASSLCEIPAGSHTFLSMANAYQIAHKL